jgi:hypothetical protein
MGHHCRVPNLDPHSDFRSTLRSGGPTLVECSATSVPIESDMSRLTSKAVFRSAVILILLGILMALVALTNPLAISMATATLLIGVAMIAIASFAGL